jgi:pantothenate kinase
MPSGGFVPVRQLVLVDLLGLMLAVRPGERAVVAVDGVDGAGKTRLTQELVALAAHVAGREVLRVSIDGFHRPAAQRYTRGRGPESYYRDSYDYDAFRRAVHDVQADRPVHPDPVEPSEDALLLVDGIFLRRPELAGEWDATLFVDVPFEVAVPRSWSRFPGHPPEHDDPDHPANARYVGGQRLYLQQARLHPPTWILDNTDLQRPQLIHPDPEDESQLRP